MTKDDEYANWVASLPPLPQASALSHPPDKIYRMASTGQRCYVYGYDGDGTVTVAFTKELNLLNMERAVYGINVSELTECDPPGADEPVGLTLDEDEQLQHLNSMRMSNGLPPVKTLDELRMKNLKPTQ